MLIKKPSSDEVQRASFHLHFHCGPRSLTSSRAPAIFQFTQPVVTPRAALSFNLVELPRSTSTVYLSLSLSHLEDLYCPIPRIAAPRALRTQPADAEMDDAHRANCSSRSNRGLEPDLFVRRASFEHFITFKCYVVRKLFTSAEQSIC